MSLDRTRVLETAQKHLAKGQYDKAIAEYRKLVLDDPNDVRTWLKIGDLYSRKGSRNEACDTYAKVAQQYAQQGFFLKAVAVYKQILKLDPDRLDVSSKLAEMYEHLQLVSDALNTYETVASAAARQGNVQGALDALARMANLDPENVPVRIKYAEALSQAERREEAAQAFEVGARLLKQQGRIDDYIKVAERLLFHRGEDAELARELAVLYLERQDPKRALSKLQICFKANPRDVGTLELLARAFEILGQVPKTISVYREVARIHLDAERPTERARVLKRILDLDPHDAEARHGLAGYSSVARPAPEMLGPPASAVVDSRTSIVPPRSNPPPGVVDAYDDEPELEVIEDEQSDVLLVDDMEAEIVSSESYLDDEPATGPARRDELLQAEPPTGQVRREDFAAAGMSPSVPPDIAREAQVARLLTECDVFMRYGLKTKVQGQLRRVLEIDPTHVIARERLKDLYIDNGQIANAVVELHTLADLLELTDPVAAAAYTDEARQLTTEGDDVRPADAMMPRHADGAAPGGLLVPVEDVPATGSGDEDEILFVDDESAPDLPTGLAAIAPVEDELLDRGEPPPAHRPASPIPREDRRAFSPGLAAPAAPAALPSTVEVPTPPRDTVASADVGRDQGLAPMSPQEFEAAPLRPSHPDDMQVAEERVSRPPGEIEEILEEAEFFVAQGLMEEARSTLDEALNSHPNHPLLIERHQELLASIKDAPPVEKTAFEGEDDAFLLAEKLAEELDPDEEDVGSDVLDVETVFAQFKKGVEEQIGLEDSDTHFDLGIAYKEMGLLDDAIHEFELSMSNPQRLCIAHTMIGLCFVEKGDVAEAIARFKKGLYADTKTDREELGLYFELGTAYELLGDPKEALYYFQKVQKRDDQFRNVRERIRVLTGPQTGVVATQDSDGDELDRAFDDLMKID